MYDLLYGSTFMSDQDGLKLIIIIQKCCNSETYLLWKDH